LFHISHVASVHIITGQISLRLLVCENVSSAMTNVPFSVFVFVCAVGLISDDSFEAKRHVVFSLRLVNK